MNANDLVYPLLRIRGREFSVVTKPEWLETVFKPLLDDGFYTKAEYVTADGKRVRIRSMKELGRSSFWNAINPFMPKRVRVEAVFELVENHDVNLDEIRSLVLSELTEESTWASRADFDEIRSKIATCDNVRGVIEALVGDV